MNFGGLSWDDAVGSENDKDLLTEFEIFLGHSISNSNGITVNEFVQYYKNVLLNNGGMNKYLWLLLNKFGFTTNLVLKYDRLQQRDYKIYRLHDLVVKWIKLF